MAHTQTTPSDSQPKKKKASPFKVTLIILGLVSALLVLKIVLILTAKPTISVDYVAELSRISKPADYDPNKNAASDYQKAIETYVRIPPQIFDSVIVCAGNMHHTELGLLNEWLAANEEVLSQLRRASYKPYLWTEASATDNSLWHYEPRINLWVVREFGYLLVWHAKSQANQGRFDSALENMAVSDRLAFHFKTCKTVSHQLVGLALQSLMAKQTFFMLANEEVDSETLKGLQQQLECRASQHTKQPDLECEKLFALDTVQRIFTDDGRGGGHLIPQAIAKGPRRVLLMASQPDTELQAAPAFYRKLIEYFDRGETSEPPVYFQLIRMALFGQDRRTTVQTVEKYFHDMENLKTQSLWQLRRNHIDRENRTRDMLNSDLVLGRFWYLPSLIEYHRRCEAQRSALLTTIALLRYRAHAGKFPKTLGELVSAGYLGEVPVDPYSDGPLVYKRLGDDFTLYSLGADFDDDDGLPSKWGEGQEGGDHVFWPVQRPDRQDN
ncbi:MAG: hypothetical protein ACYTEQ_08920 [Planctomycetota bacterium]|jgi:hypothetical protein